MVIKLPKWLLYRNAKQLVLYGQITPLSPVESKKLERNILRQIAKENAHRTNS